MSISRTFREAAGLSVVTAQAPALVPVASQQQPLVGPLARGAATNVVRLAFPVQPASGQFFR